jgi:1-acyl-sn-glycerol-3-phosphate acyltransferase
MSRRDALVLFPEGGNVTEKRREGAIRHLRLEGLHREAEQAAAMRHVVAPRPGGVLAAVAANPGADVVFVSHSGLAGMTATLWRRVPVDITLLVHLWLVPAARIPTDEAARLEWLFGWWQRIDDWVSAQAGDGRRPPCAAGA